MRRLILLAILVVGSRPVLAQRRDDQAYFPGGFNWSFLHRSPEAARLFNAFDFGHAGTCCVTRRDSRLRKKR